MISNIRLKLLFSGYILVIIALFLYSFTQIDLGLTLTRWSPWQVAQKFFQSIGYFNRPLSTLFYIVIILLLFAFYLPFLKLADKKTITKRQVWILILTTSFILGFSYNAFSYDLFNYMFDAKIITFYHQNPYFYKALDFPGDPMLSFMHWTHRTYPYGPVWLALTVPFSFFGFQLLLPTFFLFKGIMTASFLGTAFFIGKILQKIAPERELFGVVFFGLNPLIIIESLVSAHNDIVMIFFLILVFYLLMNKKYFRSLLLFILSIGIKFATVLLFPLLLVVLTWQRQKKEVPWDKIWFLSIILMIITVVLASVRTNFQPWYLIYVLPFAALFEKRYFVLIPTLIITLGSLLQYVPFLYLGNWNKPVPAILLWIMISSIVLSVFFSLIWYKIKHL